MISPMNFSVNTSPKFSGTHRFVGLREANPRNKALDLSINAATVESLKSTFEKLVGPDSVQVTRAQDGILLQVNGGSICNLVMKNKVIEENGLLGSEISVTGNANLVNSIDSELQRTYAFLKQDMNATVPDRKPGEEAKYTFIA